MGRLTQPNAWCTNVRSRFWAATMQSCATPVEQAQRQVSTCWGLQLASSIEGMLSPAVTPLRTVAAGVSTGAIGLRATLDVGGLRAASNGCVLSIPEVIKPAHGSRCGSPTLV
jgi:hypothetical protein